MNGNDLMNALGGLDPKYIDEAALELRGNTMPETGQPGPESTAQIKKARISRIKKFVFVALPAAAVILISLTVTLPFLMRMSKSSSASMPASDSAAYDSESAQEAAEAAADTAPVSNAEESAAAEAPAYEAEEAAADSAADTAAAYEAEEAAEADKSADSDTADLYSAAEESENIPALGKAVYKDGILTVEINGVLPSNAEELKYSIKETAADGSEKLIAEGNLGDILTERDPLTLDLSELDLPEGVYTLSVGEESTGFEIVSSSKSGT